VLDTVTGDGREKTVYNQGHKLEIHASKLIHFKNFSDMILRGTGMKLPL